MILSVNFLTSNKLCSTKRVNKSNVFVSQFPCYVCSIYYLIPVEAHAADDLLDKNTAADVLHILHVIVPNHYPVLIQQFFI